MTGGPLPVWGESKTEFLAQVAAVRGTLKIGLKTKDEALFLERWIAHHARIVGLENLVIVDNMSSDEQVHAVYRKYQSSVPIVRFDGFYDSLHDGGVVPQLYNALARSCDYFLFLDTDEFLVHIAGDTYSRDARMLDVLRRERCDVFPGTWLENVPGSDTRFLVGTKARDYLGLIAWGKPLRRTAAPRFGRRGHVNHNVDVDKRLYRVLRRPQFFILHMRHLDVRQRIKANINHLIARELVSPEETLESILGRELAVAGDGHIGSMVEELRSLAATFSARTPFPGTFTADSWLELTPSGCVGYSGARQAAAMRTFLTNSEWLCRMVLETSGEDLRTRPGATWRRWEHVLDQHQWPEPAIETAAAISSGTAVRNTASRQLPPVCIAGMFHSGASLVARLLHATGLFFGDVDDSYEHSRFVALNDEVLNQIGGGWDRPVRLPAKWKTDSHLAPLKKTAQELLSEFHRRAPWGWADPRNSLTLPFWQAAAGPLKIVVCLRHPLDVVLELRARHRLSNALALHLWTTYYERILSDSRPADRLVTDDEAYSTDPDREVARVLTFCGLDVSASPSGACKAIIEGHRPRGRSTNADLAAAELAPDVLDLYGRLLVEAGRPQDIGALAAVVKPRGARPSRSRPATPADGARQVNPFVVDLLNERNALKTALTAKDRALAAKDAAIGVREATYLELLTEISDLRTELALKHTPETEAIAELEAGLAYEQLRWRLYDTLDDAIPLGATVLMVSRGDDAFLRLDRRQVSHFPRTKDGTWNGHPSTSQDAIDQLEAIRATTTVYLVFPTPELWWLEHYLELATYLQQRGELIVKRQNTAMVFKLSGPTP